MRRQLPVSRLAHGLRLRALPERLSMRCQLKGNATVCHLTEMQSLEKYADKGILHGCCRECATGMIVPSFFSHTANRINQT